MAPSESRVVLVTGGADGFGAAIVDRFHQEGSKVIFIDLNDVKGSAKAATSPDLTFIHGDVTSVAIWEQALAVAEKEYGRLDVVVNNAACPHIVNGPIRQDPQLICPFMLKQGGGIFINLTSTGCTRPRPGFAFYNAAKAGLASKTMALEYAPTIRFNCICPAIGDTAMLERSIGNDNQSAEKRRKIEGALPLQRLTKPTDIANAAWFLGSDQGSFLTGTTIEVDGGRGI
ncbi:hypothetical protein B0J15DRAFT_406094 [Fusarium solani]|uniref:Uncharacterized protein n=1 Tax=Fusarium solani TaxID=169388 RepID=A0A9P9JZ31_FUSSL|nr:uncharacterized protein B0J15DRAFT_406094 [Fusarium solani]KAH7237975.1 hypothetical protein B0J15DRAFT_406094 [Fusarium solani]